MSKQIRQISDDQTSISVPSFQKKILPLKHRFITFKSFYDYGAEYEPQVRQILKKNPKWCHLSLELGHPEECKEYSRLRRARSLRLRSIHLESYALDSQDCGDRMNGYGGELDVLIRVGQTLKKLSLSVIHDIFQPKVYNSDSDSDFEDENSQPEDAHSHKSDAYHRLKKFVKKQKNLDEFGLYMGGRGNSKWMSGLLRYMEKTVKTLTIENMAIDNLFKKYEFPKLETLRFEYMLFYGSEDRLDFSVLGRSLQGILALASLKALVFSQYQRYNLGFYKKREDEDDEQGSQRSKGELQIPPEFWEELKTELSRNKDKPLKIKHHMNTDLDIQGKLDTFKRIFGGLPECQTFEYEIARFSKLSNEEAKARGLQVEYYINGFKSWYHYWIRVRCLFSLGQVETTVNIS